MLELDKKLLDQFQGYVVRKDVVRSVKGGANVPVFVWNICLQIHAVRMMNRKSRKELRM